MREAIATLDVSARRCGRSACRTRSTLWLYITSSHGRGQRNLARYDGVKYGLHVPDAQTMWDWQTDDPRRRLRAEVKRRIMLGTYALSAGYYDAYYLKAQKVRTLIERDFDRAFEQVDVIAAPVAQPWPSRSAKKPTIR